MVKLVYMVAGLSSRFEGKIKALANIGPHNETLIELSLQHALENNFSEIILIVSSKTEEQFRERIGNSYKGVPVTYALQTFDSNKRDKPWGTTDAVLSAKDHLTEPFIVLNGDDLYGKESFTIAYGALENNKECLSLAYDLWNVIPDQGEVNRGIFEIENDYVKEVVEHLGLSKENLAEKGIKQHALASMNFFGFQPESVPYFIEQLEEFKKNNSESRTAECFLPLVATNLIKSGKIQMKLYNTNSNWYGVTHPEDELLVKKQLLQDKEYVH